MKRNLFIFLSIVAIFNTGFSQSVLIDTLVVDEIVQRSDLRSFCSALSKQYGVNLYVDNDVNITDEFRFYNSSIKQIIDFIVERYDLDLQISNNVYRIKNKIKAVEEKKPDLPDIRFFDNRLSVNISNLTVQQFVSNLATISKKSILLEPNSTGSITGTLQDADFDSGLKELLAINGFHLNIKDHIYKIYKLYSLVSDDKNKNQRGYFIDYTDSLITIDVPKADLGAVLIDLSRKADINTIYYGEIKGAISAKFSVASINDVLVKLFRNTDYTFKQKDNIYYFGPKTLKDLASQEVIKLKYLRAGTGSSSNYRNNSTLGGSSRSSSTLDNRTNNNSSVPAQTVSNRVSQARNQLRQTTSRSSSGNEGFSSDALFDELEKNGIDAVPLLEQNAVLVTGSKQDIEDAKSIVTILDKPIPQILIEALIIDIKNNKGLDQEIRAWRGSSSDTANVQYNKTSYLPYEILFNASDINKFTDWLHLPRIGILPSDFLMFLSLQESKGNVKIRSKPQIATINGHEAYISIGETRYFKLRSDNIRTNNIVSDQNNSITVNEQFQQLDITNTLRVKPWVNSDGDVTVEIIPQLQAPSVNSGDPNTPPSIDFRELESTVRLKNGQTIILGGIITEEESELYRDYFPLMSWIPLIGDLFTSKTLQTSKSELMIYLTPHVYMGEEADPMIPAEDFKQ